MDNLKNEHIILSKGLNLSEILLTIKKVRKDSFVVYLPDSMEILYNPINLKIFVKELKSNLKNKKINFFSTDSHLISLLKSEGLEAQTSESIDIPNVINKDKSDLGDFFKFETLNEFDGEKDALIKKEDDIDIVKELESSFKDENIIKTNKKNRLRGVFYLIGFILIIVLAIFGTLYSAKASIKLFPNTTFLTKEMDLVFNLNKDNLTEDQIYVEEKKIESEVELEVNSTGSLSNDGTKAQGEVILKNETNSNQTLVDQTRLLSEGNKIYKISKNITIPADGEVKVTMIAENSGNEYNIQSGKLLIPGFEKDKEKYEKIYAILDTPINNGSSNGQKVVTEDDINQAKIQLKENLAKDLNEKVLEVEKEGLSVLDIGSTLNDIVYTFDVTTGQQIDKFTMRAKSSLTSLVYTNTEVEDYIKTNIEKELEERQSIMPSIKVVFSLPDSISEDKIINSKANIDYTISDKINTEELSKNFIYKNKSFVEDFLNTNYDLKNYNIELTPSFLPIMPILSENIVVTIEENNN